MPAHASFVRCAFLRASCLGLLNLTLLCVLTLLASGCPDHDLAPLAACTKAVGRASVTQVPIFEVDLLFVVDDSGSMTEEQDNLARQLPELVRVLTTGKLDDDHTFRPVDLHVGVISTDMGGFATTG